MKPLFTVTLRPEHTNLLNSLHHNIKTYDPIAVLDVANGKFLIAYETYNNETFFTTVDPVYFQLSSKLEGVLG